MFRSALSRVSLGLVALLPVAAMAAGAGPAAPDLSALTPDFTTVTTAMLAIAGQIHLDRFGIIILRVLFQNILSLIKIF